jgi:hypothetical protein
MVIIVTDMVTMIVTIITFSDMVIIGIVKSCDSSCQTRIRLIRMCPGDMRHSPGSATVTRAAQTWQGIVLTGVLTDTRYY